MKMWSRLSLLGALALTGCGASPTGIPTPTQTQKRVTIAQEGPKLRVAVGEFGVDPAVQAVLTEMKWEGITPLIAEQVVTGLTQSGRVAVLERSQLDKLIKNMKVETDSDTAEYFDQSTTAEKGKFLGAQVVFVGAITEVEPNVSGSSSGINVESLGNAKFHTDKAVVGIDVRLVDQETGRVLHAAHAQGVVSTEKFEGQLSYLNVDVGGQSWSKTPLGIATREAANDAIAQLTTAMKTIPWEAPVVGAQGEKLFIGAGLNANLKKGDRFTLMSRGEAITDMEGNVIGYDERDIGQVEVQSVQDKMSVATVNLTEEAAAPKRGDVVRLSVEEPGH